MQKTALITGATSGIGYEVALILAQKGYNLFLASRNQERLKQIKTDFHNQYHIDIDFLSIDLSENDTAGILFNYIQEKGINIDIVVNNAGFGIQGEHCSMPLSSITNMITLNVISLTHLCTLFGNEMKKRHSGYILNVASNAAFQPVPYFSVYAATKSYVLNFSEALAKELEAYNVVVTCLCPGVTDTNFFNAAGIGEKKQGVWANKTRMSAQYVAEYGVNALFNKKLSIIPGFKNKFLVFLTRFTPRSLVAYISNKMISHAV